MSRKSFVLIFAVTIPSLALAYAEVHRDAVAPAGAPIPRIESYTATVEVESIRVLSYLDEDGVSHPPDSTLIPPVPIQGPREFLVERDRQPVVPAQIAGRDGPR